MRVNEVLGDEQIRVRNGLPCKTQVAMREMNKRKRLFSKRTIIILSIVLSVFLLMAVRTTRRVLLGSAILIAIMILWVVILPIQESFAQRRLLCDTDHQALLEECRKLSKQIASENENTELSVSMRGVPASKLSGFPTIKKVGGRVIVYSNGGASIEWGGVFRHFGVNAYPEDSAKPSSSSHSFPENRELAPGLWYYDDLYNRDRNYDAVVERMLRKNKTKKNG